MNLNYTAVYELSDNEKITEALGINETRANELERIVKSTVNDCDRITETLAVLWDKCNHPNEYAWCVFIYGANTGVQKAMGDLGKLKDLLD